MAGAVHETACGTRDRAADGVAGRGRHHGPRLPFGVVMLCSMAVMVAALLWSGEEPGKLETLIAVSVVWSAAVTAILAAGRAGILSSEATWIGAFAVKLIVTAVLIQYLWIPDIVGHRVPVGYDPAVYDYYGEGLARTGFDTSIVPPFNFVGVIYYIAAVYSFFGVSTWYVSLVNSILSLLTVLAIAAIVRHVTHDASASQWMWIALLVPEVIAYDAIPAKEAPATFLYAISLLCVFQICARGRFVYVALLFVALTLLAMLRASLGIGVFLIALVMCWPMVRRWSIIGWALLALAGYMAIAPQLVSLIGGSGFDPLTAPWGQRAGLLEGGWEVDEASSLNLRFLADDILGWALTVPVRLGFYVAAPWPYWSIDPFGVKYWVDFQNNAARLTTIGFLICSPAIAAAMLQGQFRAMGAWHTIVMPFFLTLLFIAGSQAVVHERFRVVADSLGVASIVLGATYGAPKRYAVPCIGGIAIASLSYFFLKGSIF